MSKAEDAALAAAQAALAVEEPETDPSVEEPPVEEDPSQGAAELPNFEPEIPEDLAAELEAEDEIDPSYFHRVEDDEYEPDEEGEDPRLTALKKERDHYKNLRLAEARKRWVDEAAKFFPLSVSVLPQIQAESRRSFLRQAKAAHETVLPFVREYKEKAEATVEAAREEARAEARKEAEKAWGKVAGEEPRVPTEAEDRVRIERARARGDFGDVVKAMLFPTRG